jgi:citrate lyase beta subunit
VRHFGSLTAADAAALFERLPQDFGRDSGSDLLSVALGATLYMPGDRPALAADIAKQATAGVTSVVVCLEDAIADDRVADAEANIVASLGELHRGATADGDPGAPGLPLVFVRVREPGQITALVDRLGDSVEVLDGFVLPKFTAATGTPFLTALDTAERSCGRRLWAMPVIESGTVLYAESRVDELARLRALLHRDRHRVLAVRLGATDLCALYGLRRTADFSIYDVKVVADLIADVVNVLGRADGTGFTVTGPVWEYYGHAERLFKPQLRRTPFEEHDESELRGSLVSRAIDGLIREVQLDRVNGLQGKTAIHPSHVAIVNALSVVSSEEYHDARDVAGTDRPGGVMASGSGVRMNEIRPHAAWARRTLLRAEVFGVSAPGVSVVDLLASSLSR